MGSEFTQQKVKKPITASARQKKINAHYATTTCRNKAKNFQPALNSNHNAVSNPNNPNTNHTNNSEALRKLLQPLAKFRQALDDNVVGECQIMSVDQESVHFKYLSLDGITDDNQLASVGLESTLPINEFITDIQDNDISFH